MLLTAGERMSAALLAMAIARPGHARPLADRFAGGHHHHRHARQRPDHRHHARPDHQALDKGDIVIVAGFQGVAQDTKDVTTLGRGASDTTAVALAASLGRRLLRDLHRRRRGLHRRPADRAERAPDPADQLRGDAGDGRLRGQDPAPALRGVRAAGERTGARTLLVLRQEGTWVQELGGRKPPWSRPSSPASRTTAARPRSLSSACPTGSARLPGSSRRSPRPRSTST